MRTAMLAAALVLIAPAFAFAQSDCTNAEQQSTMNQCADSSFKKSDKKLNDLYKQIGDRLESDTDTKKQLVEAQRSWISFRDAECAFTASKSIGGTVYPMLIAQCKDTLTKSRVESFENYLKCEEGDMSCPVPSEN